MISETIKPLQLVGPTLVRWQSSSLSPSLRLWAPACHLAISPRLFQKVIEGLEGKINGQALGEALLLCLRRRTAVGQASTNTGSFLVDWSRCWQQQARLRKACYHFCYTDSVLESTRFKCFVNFRQQQVTFSFHVKWKFWWNWRDCAASQRSSHCFAQSFSHFSFGWWAALWALSKTCANWKYFNSNLCWMW